AIPPPRSPPRSPPRIQPNSLGLPFAQEADEVVARLDPELPEPRREQLPNPRVRHAHRVGDLAVTATQADALERLGLPIGEAELARQQSDLLLRSADRAGRWMVEIGDHGLSDDLGIRRVRVAVLAQPPSHL